MTLRPDPKPEKTPPKRKLTVAEFRKLYGGKNSVKKIRDTKRRKRKSERQKFMDEADAWFSRKIRLKYVNANGRCRCYTCGLEDHPKNMDCGHYFNRDRKPVRWHDDNARPQCPVRNYGCNSKMDRPEVSNKFRDKLIAEGIDLDDMEIKSRNFWKYSKFQLRIIIEENKKEVNQLLIDKGMQKWW